MAMTEKHLNPTRTLLIQAAAQVFAEAGIKGATTKEIAKRANLHETTLFRHFENKQALLAAVMGQLAQDLMQAFSQHPPEWTENLHADLLFYARAYQRALIQHNDLIRMLIGEGNRHAEFLKEVMQSSNFCFKQHLEAYIEQAQLLGHIRKTLEPSKIASLFTGIIMIGVLRGNLPQSNGLTDAYLLESLDIFIHGIEAP
jgi:AcrR family transcriptional regulator